MRFGSSLIALVTLAVSATVSEATFCWNPRIRKEWRDLSSTEQQAYITAVKCLHNKPGILASSAANYGVRTRYEDFIAQHQIQTPLVHWVGPFLAWHRLLIWNYEETLRNECGYTGAQPYWDYTLDSGASIYAAVVFNPVTGFGGNGAYELYPGKPSPALPGGGCIQDGPFVDWNITVPAGPYTGAGELDPPRCIKRDISAAVANLWLQPDNETYVMQADDFADFTVRLEGVSQAFHEMGMHSGGHGVVGGDNSVPATANTDPLFWLHHANIDRIWAEWQNKSIAKLWSTGGSLQPRVSGTYDGPFIPGDAHLGYEINLGELGGPSHHLNIGQLQWTRGKNIPYPGGAISKLGVLCYEYQ